MYTAATASVKPGFLQRRLVGREAPARPWPVPSAAHVDGPPPVPAALTPHGLTPQGKMGDRAQQQRPDSERKEKAAKKKRDAAAADLELAVPKGRKRAGQGSGGISVLDLDQVGGGAGRVVCAYQPKLNQAKLASTGRGVSCKR